jgi:hypothetical protein
MSSDRTAPPEKDPELSAAAHALGYAYKTLLKRVSADPSEGRLGIARPSYAKAYTRSHDVIHALAKELGEYWWRLAQFNRASNAGAFKRHEQRMRDDAAVELLEVVHKLSPPVRRVVELRAMGTSWKDIARLLPERAIWSMTDDWRAACRMLHERHDDLVRRVN